MYDKALAVEVLSQILIATHRIVRRFEKVETPDDFILSDEGQDRLDAICMMLVAIGESLKKLDKITGSSLLDNYPQVDWKSAKGLRDIISHAYFDLNAEAVYETCKNDIPVFIETISKIIEDIK
ncbi:hypothetical protein BMS3Bbin08_00008 [bacterium BMS3Bbin08]|nr:hypothetical protein BMS3Bbin08_00008 [bacterium BMS3Bbin08]